MQAVKLPTHSRLQLLNGGVTNHVLVVSASKLFNPPPKSMTLLAPAFFNQGHALDTCPKTQNSDGSSHLVSAKGHNVMCTKDAYRHGDNRRPFQIGISGDAQLVSSSTV